MRTALVMALVMVAACAAEDERSTTSSAAGAGSGGQLAPLGPGTGGDQLGTGGAGTGGDQLGTGGAGTGGDQLGTGGAAAQIGAGGLAAAPPTDACPVDQVAGTACSNAYGYVYLPGDTEHWCTQCYEWTPPIVRPPVNYQVGCLAHPASVPSLTVQCVADCTPCQSCPPGVACVHP